MTFGIYVHQKIAFSKYFLYKSKDSEPVFMPGCSLLSLGYENIMPLYTILRRRYPDMAIATYCCGKPSKHIYGGRDFLPRISKISTVFNKKILTSCPNCYNTLKKQGFEVISIWEIINEFIQDSDIKKRGGSFTLHDPCTARKMIPDHDAVRSILKKCDITIYEFDKCREKTRCCGKVNMTMALDKKKGLKILQNRLDRRKSDTIISYCASCTESFDIDGISSYHITDLFCEKKSTYSTKNRFCSVKFIRNIAS